MTPEEFRIRLAGLGFSLRGFALYVEADERSTRRWAAGEQDIPRWVPVMLTLLDVIRNLLAASSYEETLATTEAARAAIAPATGGYARHIDGDATNNDPSDLRILSDLP